MNRFKLFLVGTIFCGFTHCAEAQDIPAGSIQSNDHAKNVCPTVCAKKGLTWNGNWMSNEDEMSVCACDSKDVKK